MLPEVVKTIIGQRGWRFRQYKEDRYDRFRQATGCMVSKLNTM